MHPPHEQHFGLERKYSTARKGGKLVGEFVTDLPTAASYPRGSQKANKSPGSKPGLRKGQSYDRLSSPFLMIAPNPEISGAPTEKMCPACEQPLWAFFEGDDVVLFCPHGRCPNSAMNDGAKADTLELAYQLLLATADEPNLSR